MDTILIEGLRIYCIIGMLPHEREHHQLLRVDIKMYIPEVWHNDKLDHSVDYSEISKWLILYVEEQEFETLENAAQTLIREMFSGWKMINEIEITLRKPAAVPQADSVGFCMRRKRSHFE